MTWQSLSDKQPRPGQAVTYRLRPNGVQVTATYDHTGPAWVLEGGHRQAARSHHQWAPARACEACGKPLVRRTYDNGRLEAPKVFAARRYCDQQCVGLAKRKTSASVPTTKACERCGKEYRRHPKEGASRFLARKYCSRSCSISVSARAQAGKPRKRRAPAAPAAPRPQPEPKPKPRPARKPRPPIQVRQEAPKRPQRHSEYDPRPGAGWSKLADPRVEQHETVRVRELGEPCAKHPTYRLNVFGQCAACVAGARWARNERRVTARPSPEGGR